MAIEVWLRLGEEGLRLPVLPPSVEIEGSNDNDTVNIHMLGEVLLLGNENLRQVTLESFFPSQQYPFLEFNNVPKPSVYIERLNRWKRSKQPIIFTVTGTDVRMNVGIDSFSYFQPDGAGDVYYSLDLVEYRRPKVRQSSSKARKPAKAKRPAKKPKKRTYRVKKGDNLWNISKRFTGNPMNYKRIAKENNISNPNLIYPGQVIKL